MQQPTGNIIEEMSLSNTRLVEKQVSSEVVFKGNFLELKVDQVTLPDGITASREYLNHPGAAAILPVLPNGNLVLLRQYRYPVQRVCIEIPAGKIDAFEEPTKAAKRELLEETGYQTSDLTHLTTIHNAIGYSNEKIVIYAATGLTYYKQRLDYGEFVEVFEATFDEVRAWILNGLITDVKTICAVHVWLERIK